MKKALISVGESIHASIPKTGKRRELSKRRKKFKQRFFNFFHRAVLDADYRGFHAFKKTMAVLGTEKDKGAVYKLFNASEKSFK